MPLTPMGIAPTWALFFLMGHGRSYGRAEAAMMVGSFLKAVSNMARH
jgi:hypothetical protein